jgi:PAS domain S-box-containing protein
VPVEVSFNPIDVDGERLIACVLQDNTDRRRVEEEQDRFFRLSIDMLCIAGLDGHFKRLNPSWQRTLGFTVEELLAEPFLNFVHPEDRAATLVEFQRLLAGADVIAFENRYRCRDGTHRWLLWNAAPVPEQERIYAVAHDITARKRAEAELRRTADELACSNRRLKMLADDLSEVADSEHQAHEGLRRAHEELKLAQVQLVQAEKLAGLGQMVAGVAHEINNPLAFVRNNVAVLRRDVGHLHDLLRLYREAEGTLAEHRPEVLARIRGLAEEIDLDYTLENLGRLIDRSGEGLKRIQQIVKDLRDFAHIDEGDRKEVDLNEGVRSTVNIISGRAKLQGVDVALDLAPLPALACSPGKVNQVVLNLLSNAIDACPGGGRVTILTRAGQDGVELHVHDTGHGIDPAIRGRVFDPFFTTKPVGLGTGLGLSISYGIVKAHGGSIAVESTPGQGAHFVVRLPTRPPRMAPSRMVTTLLDTAFDRGRGTPPESNQSE